MKTQDIIRAWKDDDYRLSLSKDQRARLPEHPAGIVELTDEDLNNAAGGNLLCTLDCTYLTPPLCR